MPSKTPTLDQIFADFSQLKFAPGDTFFWSPTDQIIYYEPHGDVRDLLHEIGHALLDHRDFSHDIELIRMERDAWTKACEIAAKYGFEIDDDHIETALDDYRDWLHARSLCPECGTTGLQAAKTGEYSCINCATKWTANDARNRRLKRSRTKKILR